MIRPIECTAIAECYRRLVHIVQVFIVRKQITNADFFSSLFVTERRQTISQYTDFRIFNLKRC